MHRSFPSGKSLTVDATNVLREVLQVGSISRNLEDPGVLHCYELGWVHSETTDGDTENVVCALPTKLHEK